MKYCKVMDYSLITKLFYTFSPRLLACSRTQYRCFPYNRLDKISNSVILRAQNRKTFSRNGIVFLKRLISAIRKVQTPPLAMLSGQKSAPESIQATVFVCTLLCRRRSSQSASTFFRAPRNFGGSATFFLLKVLVTSTAARDEWDIRESRGALAGQEYEVWRVLQILPGPAKGK